MDARAMVRKLVALAAVMVFSLGPVVAMAGEIVDGNVPANGLPQAGDVGATWNGSTHKVLRSDASGILRTTEEYPYQLQNDIFVGATDTLGIAVTTGLKQIGLAWSVSPFGDRAVRIKRKVSGNYVDPCYLYLYGSDDNVTFYPLIGSNAWVGAGQVAADTTKVVPYRMILPASTGGSASWLFYKLTLPSDIYPGRYLAIFAKRDSTVTAVSTQTLSLTFEGRWK